MTLASLPQAGESKPRVATRQRTSQRLSTIEATARLRRLSQQTDTSRSQFISEVVDIAAGLTGALGVAFVAHNASTDRLEIKPEHYAPRHLSHLPSLLQQIGRVANVAAVEETPQANKAETGEPLLIVAVPVFTSPRNEALAVAISVESPEQGKATAAYLTQLLTWIAAFAAHSSRNVHRDDTLTPSTSLRRVDDICKQATLQPDFASASQKVAEWMRSESDSDVVVIGIKQGLQRECRLVAHSATSSFDLRSETAGTLNEILDETVIAAENVQRDFELSETAATCRLQSVTNMNVAARYPLIDARGNVFGAALCLNKLEQPRRAKKLSPTEFMAITRQLALIRSAEPHFLLRKLGLTSLSPNWYRHPTVLVSALAVVTLLLIPMPLHIKCGCQVQPRHRRFVSVPYEGRLAQAVTEPGAIVTRGQLLARMDARDIEFEVSGLRAELRRSEKDRDSAMASFDTAATQMATLEVKRLQLKIDLLEDRLDNLEIRSPVDGVVIGGDPRRLEGARLAMGESLLEIGPLNELIVELEISDEDIFHIELNQPVHFRLSAAPWRTFEGRIHLVHPRSESRNGENVFVAEVAFENDELLLRPGMQGRAKIQTGRHPWGWNLFHKAWDGLVTWIAW